MIIRRTSIKNSKNTQTCIIENPLDHLLIEREHEIKLQIEKKKNNYGSGNLLGSKNRKNLVPT